MEDPVSNAVFISSLYFKEQKVMQRPELFLWPSCSTWATISATGNGSGFLDLTCIYQIKDYDDKHFHKFFTYSTKIS